MPRKPPPVRLPDLDNGYVKVNGSGAYVYVSYDEDDRVAITRHLDNRNRVFWRAEVPVRFGDLAGIFFQDKTLRQVAESLDRMYEGL